jgi:hypothetical protein
MLRIIIDIRGILSTGRPAPLLFSSLLTSDGDGTIKVATSIVGRTPRKTASPGRKQTQTKDIPKNISRKQFKLDITLAMM